MTISWKCAQHVQKWPTSQDWKLFQQLKIFLSANSEKQFHDLDFGMILLSIRCELDYDPLIEIVAGMWVYNFRVDCIR